MKVRATAQGYYGRLRNEGDEFELAGKKDFSERWMEKAQPKAQQQAGGKAQQAHQQAGGDQSEQKAQVGEGDPKAQQQAGGDADTI